jgi:EmrB/QacA subfamily drug resistance transporter
MHSSRTGAGAPPLRLALASLSLTMLLAALGTSIANVGLPTLTQAFKVSFQEIQWVVLAYLLSITILVVSAGRLGDLVGRRRLLLAGLLLFTLASVLCGMAASYRSLLAARFLQGVGAAIMMALTVAVVGEAIPREKTGSAMGLLGSMTAVGTALGPTLGGFLIAAFGWPSIFLINVPLGCLAMVLAFFYLPSDRNKDKDAPAGFDLVGAVLLALTLGAYAIGLTGMLGMTGSFELLAAALAGAGFFILSQIKGASPLIRMTMFQNPVVGAGFAMSALVTTVVMATLVVGPFYLSGALELDAARVGLAMSCGPLVAALTGIPAGRAVDRHGPQRIIRFGLIVMAAATLVLLLVPASAGVAGYIVPLVFLTAGYALFQAANNAAVMADTLPEERGVTSGLLNLSRNLGLITGASFMGQVFAFGTGVSSIVAAEPLAITAGMRMTLAVAGVLLLVALGVAAAGAIHTSGGVRESRASRASGST